MNRRERKVLQSPYLQGLVPPTEALPRLLTVDVPKLQTQNPQARRVHRWIGVAAALLFLSVGATGVLLQIQQLFGPEEEQKEQLAALTSEVSLTGKLSVDQPALDRARQNVLRALGNRPVDSIDWQIKGPAQLLTFHLGGEDQTKAEVDLRSGRIDKIEPDRESWLLRLHTGEIIGDGGKVLGLVWGTALLAMLLTGVLVYLQVYRARQRTSKARTNWRGFFWAALPVLLLQRPDTSLLNHRLLPLVSAGLPFA